MLEIVDIAQQQNAKVIAITSPHSPLAQRCDLTLTLDTRWEDTTLYTPMTSRIAFLAIIDILATGLALKMGESVELTLRRVKESLISTK